MLRTICLAFCAVKAVQSASIRACYTGFVLDKFCINRGTLLDNPSIASLEGPDKHSVHCLVDMPVCRNSGYEILAPGSNGGAPYRRAFELDSPGNAKAIALAREIGDCSTCTGNGMLKAGFSATVIGTYDPEALLPRPIIVERLLPASTTCADLGVQLANVTGVMQNFDKLYQLTLIHGSLMLTGWGFLLPMGVAVAKFLRHSELWFKIHRACQATGLIVAIAGAIIAVTQFNVFQAHYPVTNLAHGTMGAIIMLLGILQPINAYFRPPHKQEGQSLSTTRYAWEVLHKGSGYFAIFLTFPTIAIGTMLVRPEHSPIFRAVNGVGLCFIIFIIVIMLYSRKTAKVKKPIDDPDDTEQLL